MGLGFTDKSSPNTPPARHTQLEIERLKSELRAMRCTNESLLEEIDQLKAAKEAAAQAAAERLAKEVANLPGVGLRLAHISPSQLLSCFPSLPLLVSCSFHLPSPPSSVAASPRDDEVACRQAA